MSRSAAVPEPARCAAGERDAEQGVPDPGHDLPAWFRPIARVARDLHPHLPRMLPPRDGSPRRSAVLLLFGESTGEPDVLLTERAAGLRAHAGQAAFPGGAIDPTDAGPVGAAIREATEETGLDPVGVDVLTTMPPLWIERSNYLVTPVLAWWREPSPVRVVDPLEVASVHRVRLAELLDPGNRLSVRSRGGQLSPAFRADGLLIWGFTGIVLARLFEVAGLERPWDRSRVEDLPVRSMPTNDQGVVP